MDAVNRKVIQLVTYGYSLCHMGYLTWIYFESWEPIEKYDEELSKIYPEVIDSGWTYSGILDLNVYPQIVFNALVITTPWFVFLAACLSRWKIGKYLNKFQFSDNVKHQHKSLLNLLLYQTIGPFFYTITVILYIFIGRTSTQASALLENLIPFPLFFMCAVSPIITLYLIAPYRLACIKVWERLFGAKWKVTSGVVEQSTEKSVAVVT
ncbi:hypothetical protein CAEBREN_23594 [Caenorhabditis brenneri]|uniref:Uncharacterized protein n=1 Tax=Caenorhabditis brenneri TaxID=135651 RepID=G0MR08_CAEBE|nr:hypothetical protein CAEBREN_23594 [Caenorhabditis brenneri]